MDNDPRIDIRQLIAMPLDTWCVFWILLNSSIEACPCKCIFAFIICHSWIESWCFRLISTLHNFFSPSWLCTGRPGLDGVSGLPCWWALQIEEVQHDNEHSPHSPFQVGERVAQGATRVFEREIGHLYPPDKAQSEIRTCHLQWLIFVWLCFQPQSVLI